jgi:protease-4
MGGLDTALAYAKGKVGLPVDAKVVEYPAPKEFAEQLAQMFSGEKRPLADSRLAQALPWAGSTSGHGPLEHEIKQVRDELTLLSRLNDPMGTYARLPFDLQLH